MATNPYDYYSLANKLSPTSYQGYVASQQAAAQGPAAPAQTDQQKYINAALKLAADRTKQYSSPAGPTKKTMSSIDPGVNAIPTVDASRSTTANAANSSNTSTRIESTGATTGGGGAGGSSSAAKVATAAGAPATSSTASALSSYGNGKTQTEFGNLFKPEAYNEAWSDPEALINTYLNYVNAPTNTGGAAMTQGLGDSIGLRYLLMNNDAAASDLGTARYLDWAGSYLDQMRTAGGAAPSVDQIMGGILDPGKESVMYDNLYNNSMSADQQVSAVLSAMQYGLDGIMPSLVQSSLLSRINTAGQDYKANQLTGQNTTDFGEYLRSLGIM
jgi:hypothetical protein